MTRVWQAINSVRKWQCPGMSLNINISIRHYGSPGKQITVIFHGRSQFQQPQAGNSALRQSDYGQIYMSYRSMLFGF